MFLCSLFPYAQKTQFSNSFAEKSSLQTIRNKLNLIISGWSHRCRNRQWLHFHSPKLAYRATRRSLQDNSPISRSSCRILLLPIPQTVAPNRHLPIHQGTWLEALFLYLWDNKTFPYSFLRWRNTNYRKCSITLRTTASTMSSKWSICRFGIKTWCPGTTTT